MHKFDDIIPPSRRKDGETLSNAPRAHRRSRFPYLTTGIVLVIIVGSVAALMYFSSAKIEVTPNAATAEVQSTFTATAGTGDLPFKLITAQKVASQSMKGTGTKNVTSSASGMITIYNTQSKPQTLVAKTRFQTTAGLVYRIQAPITIPAGSTDKPGAINAKVVADQPGSSYNVGPTSFTVPGFAGTPQANQVYAKSTAPMAGGASGAVPTVATADEVQARAALKTALATDLQKSLEEELANTYAGYVLIAGSATTTYTALDPAPSTTEGMVDVKQEGTITAVIFPNQAIAKAVASSVAGLGYQGEPIMFSSTDTVKLTPTAGFPDSNATSFSFALSGTASLVYDVDTARIAAAVAGKTKTAAETALTAYPEVSRAIIILRPFWKQTFPEDPAAIQVSVVEPSK
jgi:hypothetical protein